MKTPIAVLLLLVAASFAAPARAADVQILPGRVLISFRKGTPAAERRAMVERLGGKVLAEYDRLGILVVKPGVTPAEELRSTLSASSEVTATEDDFRTNWLLDEPALDAPLSAMGAAEGAVLRQAALTRSQVTAAQAEARTAPYPWGILKVNAPAAWPRTQGDGIKVAIIDTGITPDHPDLAGNIAGGYNAIAPSQSWADDHFHGTHVAGIVAAELNGSNVVGVAPRAKLYAVKVLDKDGSGDLSSIIAGLEWAADNGMQVANMSLGSPEGNDMFEQAVESLIGSGCVVVAAAGNGDGKGGPSAVDYPAAYPGVIAVSALGMNGTITPWSSRGSQVAFIAPGEKILSTVPFSNDPSGTHEYSGTSMAAPHVSGLAALAIALGASGPDGVLAALQAAASPIPGLSSDEQGAGLIDAGKLSGTSSLVARN